MLREALTYIRQHEDVDYKPGARDLADSLLITINAARLHKGKPAPAEKMMQQLCPFFGRVSQPRIDFPCSQSVLQLLLQEWPL